MPLTQVQAVQAGQIAAQITQLQAALSEAQQAVAANVIIQSYTANGYLGGSTLPLGCTVPLSQADSATVLNTLITIYTNAISSLNAQLAAM